MADEPTTDTNTTTATAEPDKSGADGRQDKTLTQAEVDKVVADRLARERAKYPDYDDLKSKASKFDDLEKANQTETEKLTGKVSSLTDENKTTKSENLRLKVALVKGLTGDKTELVGRLQGNTQEELEADADKLLALVKTDDGGATPDFKGGVRQTPPNGDKAPEQQHADLILGLIGGQRPPTT